jgi:hypothetical protein
VNGESTQHTGLGLTPIVSSRSVYSS